MKAVPRDRYTPAELRQRLGVETPEHVELHFDLAGVGSRAAAAILDTGLIVLGIFALGIAGNALGALSGWSEVGGWALAAVILLASFTFFGYFALFEALNGGRTPGKQALGIRVVMQTGHPVTPAAAVIRNLVRLLDCYFPLLPFLPGLLMVFLHRRNQRLGDLAAGTIVVRDHPTEWTLGVPQPAAAAEPIEAGPPELSDDEFRLLDQFLARRDRLDPGVQVRLATDLARRFRDRVPRRTADADAYLAALHADEQLKRRSRFATRAHGGAAGRTTVTAERFVAKKRDGWEAFHAVARRVERAGVGALVPGQILAFAARYREVAADLARARTYGVDPRVIEYLERVVSAGHNALYRARGRRRAPLIRYLVRDFPAAVVQSRGYVLAALLLFAVPAAAGYAIIRTRPGIADEVMPPVMLSRAERAAENEARGLGYAQSRTDELPVIASAIITNNIMVSFWAFVGGMLAGTLTVWMLVVNGLQLGMGFGLFVNYHAGGYLATFIAGHGWLELTAIFIAAGAGFRLAGAIEGLLSASDAPASLKYAVSATTVALLILYFWSGWTYLKNQQASGKTVHDAGIGASRASYGS